MRVDDYIVRYCRSRHTFASSAFVTYSAVMSNSDLQWLFDDCEYHQVIDIRTSTEAIWLDIDGYTIVVRYNYIKDGSWTGVTVLPTKGKRIKKEYKRYSDILLDTLPVMHKENPSNRLCLLIGGALRDAN